MKFRFGSALCLALLIFFQATALTSKGQTFAYGNTSVTVKSQPQVTYNQGIVYVNFDIAYSGLSSSIDYLALGEAAYEPEGTSSPTYKNDQGYYVAAFGEPNNLIAGPRKGGVASGSATNGVYTWWSSANAAGTYTVTIAWGYAYPGLGAEYYQQIGSSMQFTLVWDGSKFTGASVVGFTPSEATQSPPTGITPSSSSITYGGAPLSLTISGGGDANGMPEGPAQLEWSTDGSYWHTSNIASTSTTTATFNPPSAGSYQFRAHWGAGNGYTASFDSGVLASATAGKASLNVIPDPVQVPAGTPKPGYGFHVSGLVPPDTQGKSVSGAPSYASGYSASAPVGSQFTITVSPGNLASNNYTFTYTGTSTLTVIPQPASAAHKEEKKLGGPVELATGAESFSRQLFSFSGSRHWEFGISYNSVLAGNQSQIGPMGYGWDHPYDTRIASTGGNLIVWWDAVHFNTFMPYSNSSGIQYYYCTDQGEFFDRVVPVGTGGWTLTKRDQSQLVFNASGQLTEDHDPHGRKLILAYNTSGQLASITDPVSATSLALGYNASGLLTSATDAAGYTVTFSYDATSEMLTKVVNQDQYQVTFSYDSNHHLLTLVGNDGTVLTTDTYDPAGRVLTQADGVPGHQPLQFSYQQANPASNMVTTVTDKLGATWVYTFDPYNNMLSAKNPLGKTTTYTYSSGPGYCLSKTDALNGVTSYGYDSNGNVTSVTDPKQYVWKYAYANQSFLFSTSDPLNHGSGFGYDSNNNVLLAVDPAGKRTNWTYDQNSMPLTKKLPAGGTFTYTNTNGQLTKVQDPNGVVRQFTYDADGRLLSSTDSLGKTTTFTYDAIGNLLTTTDPLNHTTTRTYDYRNGLTSITDPTGAVTTYTYDNNNNLLTTTDPLGDTVTNTYDGNDRLIGVADPLGHTKTLAYDTAGELTSVTDPTGNVTQYQYDAAGRCTAVIDPLGNKTAEAYDPRSLLLSVTDPLNRQTTYAYDAASRKTSSTDPLTHATSFAYDAANRLTGVTDPGALATAQAFDADSNRSTLTDAAGNAISFAYDPGDRVTSMTTAGGKKTAYTYDQRGLPSTVTAPAGTTTTPTYDDAGRVTSMADSVGTITTTRDADGRVLTETENGKTLTRVYDTAGLLTQYTDGAGNVIGYAYDKAGNLTTLTYPDGKTVTYGYDNAGRLTSVTDWASRVTTYKYDGDGRLTTTTRPNGTTQTRTYDNAGELSSISENGPGGTVIYSDAYTYDAASRLTGETLSPSMPVPPAGQLAQTFDADNRLVTSAGQSATFDANGNLLSLPGATPSTYTYDARNRLTSAGGITYGYDSDGSRTSLTDATGTTSFVVNPNAPLTQVLVRTAPDGTVTRYVYGLGLAYEETGASARYYHYDRRGDTVALTDGTGSVLGRWTYGAYGELTNQSGQATTQFLFNGLDGVVTDSNGLYYHRARYYNPLLRRFLNQDPTIAGSLAATSLNRYAYANGCPISLVDPFGLAATDLNPSGWMHRLWNSATSFGAEAAAVARQDLFDVEVGAWLVTSPAERAYRELTAELAEWTDENVMSGLGGSVNDLAMLAPILAEQPELDAEVLGSSAMDTGGQALADASASSTSSLSANLAGSGAAENGAADSSMLARYLNGSGGRWGGTSTRLLNDSLATDLESSGYTITGGAGRASEEWIPGAGGGTAGGTFVDITATNGSSVLRIQTISTLSDGVTPTAAEAAAAARIQAAFPNDQLLLVPKW